MVIVGVLAAIAIPHYGAHADPPRNPEATEHIARLMVAAKAVALQNDPDGDGVGRWPKQASHAFPIDQPTEQFTYRIVQGAGGPSDRPFAVQAVGKEGTRVAGHVLTIWVDELKGPTRTARKTARKEPPPGPSSR